ncbi:hypothetical protein MMC29_003531 [Sticta canariensis]|nr:hypothetical protein [Sticta canariensis]
MISAESLVSATPGSASAGAALHERDRVQSLLQAAQSGATAQLMEAALQFQDQDINRVRDGRGRTALHFAAQMGHTDTCKCLLEALKADANSQADEGKPDSKFLLLRS